MEFSMGGANSYVFPWGLALPRPIAHILRHHRARDLAPELEFVWRFESTCLNPSLALRRWP
jgi:hypothetical protein